jgi:hypothetical protein
MPPEAAPQRRDARFRIAAGVLVEDAQSHERRNGTVENVSRSGCFVRMTNPFLTWTRVRLWVVYRQDQFEAEGCIVHAVPNRGMGVEFEKINDANRAMLEAWIKQLSA